MERAVVLGFSASKLWGPRSPLLRHGAVVLRSRRTCPRIGRWQSAAIPGKFTIIRNASVTSVREAANLQEASPEAAFVLLDVEGMMCGGCVARVRGQLMQDYRVESAAVNLLTETAAVKLRPGCGKQVGSELADLLTGSGFPASLRSGKGQDDNAGRKIEELSKKRKESLRKSTQKVAFAWTLVALCCGTHATHLLHFYPFIHDFMHSPVMEVAHDPLFKCVVALTTLLGPARDLVVDGGKAFLKRAPNMNTLVGFGAWAAFSISAMSLTIPELNWGAPFFDEPVMLLGFVLLGRSLEERARIQASSDMQRLLSLIPAKSRLQVSEQANDENLTVDVATEQVRAGDRVLVLPGEVIPIDGTVVIGRSSVDESTVTGEPMLMTKTVGDTVSAGTVNWDGPIQVTATCTGASSSISSIIKMVEEAQGREAPVQRLADTIAGPFAFAIMALSASTFSFWYFLGTHIFPDVLLNDAAGPEGNSLLLSLKLAIDVLVVACPCALGLATPTAVLVGTSLGAKQGLLLRGGDVLERLASVNAVVFDKTGTLTQGHPNVSTVMSGSNDFDKDRILQLAATVEEHSVHPIASAIVEQANTQKLEMLVSEGQLTEPGYGALARIDGKVVAVGQPRWVQECCLKLDSMESTDEGESKLGNLLADRQSMEQSSTTVYVGVEGVGIVGAIALSDTLRADSKVTVSRLRDMKIRTLILSGDRKEAVASIGRTLGIEGDSLFAQLRPSDKSKFIAKLRDGGSIVAMIGDGINDAPALASADVGIALKLQNKIDAASDAASVILLGNRLSQVLDALSLSKATMSKVYQNLGCALAYNLIAVPVAAGVLLPGYDFALSPSAAGGMMALSSIFVVSNSLLLRLHRPPKH
ncbi:copper-transporting ATPase PAA2, chloroplastic [Selaginella moellendorffii]|nr:copper-transporting ATPase PAA2, chloroplastic [Selaginella moellendorffii]|eukprot:XP_002974620.2 copper-transporting ATPase PAA2, chloroplastic [Selaginella moellendorffii]